MSERTNFFIYIFLYIKRLVRAESVGVMITIISSLDYAAQAVLLHQCRVCLCLWEVLKHKGKKRKYTYK